MYIFQECCSNLHKKLTDVISFFHDEKPIYESIGESCGHVTGSIDSRIGNTDVASTSAIQVVENTTQRDGLGLLASQHSVPEDWNQVDCECGQNNSTRNVVKDKVGRLKSISELEKMEQTECRVAFSLENKNAENIEETTNDDIGADPIYDCFGVTEDYIEGIQNETKNEPPKPYYEQLNKSDDKPQYTDLCSPHI